jgi:DNA-binding CsgD family transcriptional regulator
LDVEDEPIDRWVDGLEFRHTMSSEPDFSKLTPQEHLVLDLLGEGADGGTIAAKLGLSRKIVRDVVQSIMQKLGVHSRLEAAALQIRSDKDYALRTNLRRLPRGTARRSFAGSLPKRRTERTSRPRRSRGAKAALRSPST